MHENKHFEHIHNVIVMLLLVHIHTGQAEKLTPGLGGNQTRHL
jgi:hypothetical protein